MKEGERRSVETSMFPKLGTKSMPSASKLGNMNWSLDLKVSDLSTVPACGPSVLLSAQAEDRTSQGPYGLPTSTNLLSRRFNLWVFLYY